MLQAMFYMILIVSLIYLVVSCIAISEADKPENFTIGEEKKEKLSPKDCWKMIKGNRALQMYIVAAASDKLALQTAGNAAFTTIVFVIVRVLMSAGQNGASSCTGAMMADIADYEVARTGNFLPGTVAACYSFVDKLISSFSTTIAGFSLAIIGYTTTMPQPGDPATLALRVLAIIMTLGMPIIGWVCTIIAMKFYPLSTEKMVEVQTQVHEMREAAKTK